MQLWSGRAVIPLLAVGPGQNTDWGPEKLDFFCSKGGRLSYCFFIFHVKFSAVCLSQYRWYMLAFQALACIKGSQMWTVRPIWNNATGTLTPWKGQQCLTKICTSLQTLRQPEQERSTITERNVSLYFRQTITCCTYTWKFEVFIYLFRSQKTSHAI